jgi:Na+-transporting NADH:ubiquinone oxidoreductase subunit NqrD
MPIRTAMMAITTRSSIRVNARGLLMAFLLISLISSFYITLVRNSIGKSLKLSDFSEAFSKNPYVGAFFIDYLHGL